MAYLYRHIRLDKNVPFYIGIGSDNKKQRAFSKSGRNKYWQNIVKLTNYEVEIMVDDISWNEACEKEKYFIQLYGKFSNGTLANMTDGGDGIIGLKRGIEFSRRNSEIHLGKKYNLDVRNKMSKSHKGKILSVEHKSNISKAVSGRILTDCHKQKIGNSNKSVNHGNWNGYICQFDKEGNLLAKYDTLNNAMISTNVDYRDISKVCTYYNFLENNVIYNYTKNHKSAGGFIWKRTKKHI